MATDGSRRGRLEEPHLEKRHQIAQTFALNGVGRCSLCDAIVRDGDKGCPGPPIIVDGVAPPPPPPPTTPEQLAYVQWETSLSRSRNPAGQS
jgi:hypothetical protein